MITASQKVKEKNIVETLNRFFRSLMEKNIVDALLVTQKSMGKGYVQTLVKNPEEITHANPFAPVLIENSAKLVSYLSAWEPGQRIGVVLRSCEIRALIELAKFKQANLDRLVIIGADCTGTVEPADYKRISEGGKEIGEKQLFVQDLMRMGCGLRTACECCVYPVPANVDITVGFIGIDANKEIFIQIADNNLRDQLGIEESVTPENREKEVSALIAEREKRRKELLQQLKKRFGNLTSILEEFVMCRKCYSCRFACPICYCKECVFLTPTFEYKPEHYLKWANRKGKIKLPYQTILYHLTRLNHMVTSCVECGQCSSACPNSLPVFELFAKVGVEVQSIFEYIPGQSVDEEPPVSTFKEKELESIGGD